MTAPCYETYAQARRLAGAISAEKASAFTTEAIDRLRQHGRAPTVFAVPGVSE